MNIDTVISDLTLTPFSTHEYYRPYITQEILHALVAARPFVIIDFYLDLADEVVIDKLVAEGYGNYLF